MANQVRATVSFASELSSIDAEIGTEIWVEEERRAYKARPSYALGGIHGPSDTTPIKWIPEENVSYVDDSDVLNTYAFYDFGVPSSVQANGVSGADPNLNNWTAGGVTKAVVTSPDGGSATALTESGTTDRWIQQIAANTHGPGWTRIRFSFLPGAQYPAQRYMVLGNAYAGSEFLALPSKASLRYPESDISYSAYQATTDAFYDGFKFTLRDSGWIDVEYEFQAHVAGTYGSRLGMISTRGTSTVPIAGVAMTVGPLVYEQSRVVSVVPTVGTSDSVLTQETDSARPVLAPDIWIGGGSCLVEGHANSCAISGPFPGGKTWSAAAIVWVRQVRPTSTARTVFELTGTTASIKLQVNTTGKWVLSRTNDSGVTVTSALDWYVAPVPVHALLVHSNGTLSLYIDGYLAGTLSYTSDATVTGVKLFGGDSKSEIRSFAVWTTGLNSADIGTVCSYQRSAANLPKRWPVVIHSGQSNTTVSRGNTMRLSSNGAFSRPGYATYCCDYSAGNSDKLWLPGVLGNPIATSFGLRVGYAMAAQENGEQIIEINCASGGTAITEWLAGGAMYTFMPQQISNALSSLGTPLWEVTDFTWVQGEAEANSSAEIAGAYLSNLRTLRTQIRALYGSGVRFTIHRLNTWLGTRTADYLQADTVRAAQDVFWAEDANTFMSRLDGGQWLDYNVHYTNSAITEIGKLLYRVSRSLSHSVQISNVDYPQRGTWGTGAFWDAENGVVKTGDNITTITAREGGAVLTAVGTPKLLTTWTGSRKCFSFADAAAYMTCVDGTKWAGFGGTNIALILAIQFTIPTLAAGKSLLNFCNSDNTHGQANLVTHSTPTTLNAIAKSAGNTPISITNTLTIAENTVKSLVYCVAGTSRYIISGTISPQIGAAQTDFSGVVTAPDRLILNGLLTDSGGGLLVRRLGVKLAATTNPLAEAIDLYTSLSSLG
jgi:hypothetical protein